MKENAANTVLNKYLREMRKKGFYCYYELKVARGNRFTFSNIEDNQDKGLPALAREGLVWKLSDEDSRKKPCDGISAPPLPAFLVIKFDKTYFFIEYEKITKLRATRQKSLTFWEAQKLSTKTLRT